MFKVNNKNTRKRCEIYSKLTIKTRGRSGVFIDNFEHISHLSSVSVVDLEQVNVSWEHFALEKGNNLGALFLNNESQRRFPAEKAT